MLISGHFLSSYTIYLTTLSILRREGGTLRFVNCYSKSNKQALLNLVTFRQIIRDIFWFFSIFLLFSHDSPFIHECLANLCHFLAHFGCFLFLKMSEIAKFSLKVMIFCHFEYYLPFWCKILSSRVNFQISANFGKIFIRTPYSIQAGGKLSPPYGFLSCCAKNCLQ